MTACSAPDARALRRALGAYVTGVTIVTTRDAAGRRHGLTVNSFSSVSLDPPLILWSQSVGAPSFAVFRDADRFAVNVLAEDQVALSRHFSTPASTDRFAGLALHDGLDGVPLIDGCSAWFECRRETSWPGGDHLVHVGRVERFARAEAAPLVFGNGQYLCARPHGLVEGVLR